MGDKMYEVIFYKDKNGNEPIKEYLFELKKMPKQVNTPKYMLKKYYLILMHYRIMV